MSDAEKPKSTPSLDLSGLDFGPSWAKNDAPKRDYSKEVGPRDRQVSRGKGRGPRRDDRRDQKGRNGGSNERRAQRKDHQGRGRGPRNDRERRPQYEETPAPEGFSAQLLPVEAGLDNLARQIQASGRTYSVFDLAKIVTGARERFLVSFQAPKNTKLFRCRLDGSLWLTRDEALRHFWKAKLHTELYEEVKTEGEAPKGNFTSVAQCGMSGEYLGPPNYHSYQSALLQKHREQFSHIPLEDYKRKVQVKSDEDAVNAWLEQMKTQIRFRPLTADEITARREERKAAEASKESPATSQSENTASAPAPEQPTAENTEAPDADESAPHEPASETGSSDDQEPPEQPITNTPETSSEPAPEPTEDPVEPSSTETELIAERRELERHFQDNHFKSVFAEVEKAWVPGNVPGKNVSPGLLTLLKATVMEERRYPAKLTPLLCRQLSGRHLAVFKWQKKLKAGPARPHAIPSDINLAERPAQLLAWLKGNSGKNLEDLWKDILPEGADDSIKRGYYHDLHWILNQGYALLMADGILLLAKATAPTSEEENNESKVTQATSPPEANNAEPQEKGKASTQEAPQNTSPAAPSASADKSHKPEDSN